MRIRVVIAALIALPVNAVLLGSGALAVLAIPELAQQAQYLLPAVISVSFLATVPISWFLVARFLAPRLGARKLCRDAYRKA